MNLSALYVSTDHSNNIDNAEFRRLRSVGSLVIATTEEECKEMKTKEGKGKRRRGAHCAQKHPDNFDEIYQMVAKF